MYPKHHPNYSPQDDNWTSLEVQAAAPNFSIIERALIIVACIVTIIAGTIFIVGAFKIYSAMLEFQKNLEQLGSGFGG